MSADSSGALSDPPPHPLLLPTSYPLPLQLSVQTAGDVGDGGRGNGQYIKKPQIIFSWSSFGWPLHPTGIFITLLCEFTWKWHFAYPSKIVLLCRACNLTSFSSCLTSPVDYPFASCHEGPGFKSPGGYFCETGILLLALSRYIGDPDVIDHCGLVLNRH